MNESIATDSAVRPKRRKLQFGLGGMVLSVMFAGSVGLVAARWDRWAVEKVVKLQRDDGAYYVGREYVWHSNFEKSTQPKTLVNAETQKELSIPADKCKIEFGRDRLVTIDDSYNVKIWDWDTGESIELPDQIRFCSLTPDGHKLLVWNETEDWSKWDVSKHVDITAKWQVFDTANGSIKAHREFNERSYISMFSPDGTYVVLRFGNRKCVVWNLIRDTILSAQDVLSFTADSKNIVCNTWSAGLTVLNADDGTLVRRINSPDIVRANAIDAANEDQLFVGAPNGSLEIFDSNGIRMATLPRNLFTDEIEIASNRRHLLVWTDKGNGSSGMIRKLCDRDGTLSSSFQTTFGALFSPDGSKVYTISEDRNSINIWGQRFPDGSVGHLFRPEVWLAIIFGSIWLWRASVWWRGCKVA